jgi:hypothetical protein
MGTVLSNLFWAATAVATNFLSSRSKPLGDAPSKDAKSPLFGVYRLDVDQNDVVPIAVQPLAQEHVSYAVGIGSQAFLILVEDKPTVVQSEGRCALLDLLNNAYTLLHTFVAGL